MPAPIEADTLQKFIDLVLKTKDARAFRPDAEPNHVYVLQKPDGTTELKQAAPVPRQHLVGDLFALRDALLLEKSDFPHTIFYSRHGVVGIYHDLDRRDRVVLPLGLSPQILELQRIEKMGREAKSQEQMISWLR